MKTHLSRVAEVARSFASEIHTSLDTIAYTTGLLHDLGKYRDQFQEYLRKERSGSAETQHAIHGAAIAFEKALAGPAFAIAAHHAGLQDLDKVQAAVERAKKHEAPERLLRFLETDGLEVPTGVSDPAFVNDRPLRLEMYIRMLFSILVDADHLSTEAFYRGKARTCPTLDPSALLNAVFERKKQFDERACRAPGTAHDTLLKRARDEVFERCVKMGEEPRGFHSLTVPTGGGKTLSAMAFALSHAKTHGLQRVIVVIPYLTIIEQNAAVYREILDPESNGIVVEHHSAAREPDGTNEPDDDDRSSRSAENWDAPVIVTTSVQFIETLFAHSASRCRKLHNICNSIVIFDEVQTLPAHLLNPTLDAFRDLTENYGVSFVFASATQPAFRASTSLTNGFSQGELREIVSDPAALFDDLKRVEPVFHETTQTWEQVASLMAESRQALCVVNTRKQAMAAWEALRRATGDAEDGSILHLSSAMCPQHRLGLIGDPRNPDPDSIRARLRAGRPCLLVSTQLIEAGVDLDFPLVMRAAGPLDSIVQAAGRCNREFRLKDAAGNPVHGRVIIFRPEDQAIPGGVYKTATGLATSFLQEMGPKEIFVRPELFGDYFSRLFSMIATDVFRKGQAGIQEDRENLRFRQVGKKAKVIPEESYPIVVPYGDARSIIDELRTREPAPGEPRFSRHDLRRLQRFMVNVRSREFLILQGLHLVHHILPNIDVWVLEDGVYHPEL
ncbi:CRISPR-associated endonuclease Cas3'', partial [Candidatus Ozemobacteraceae bacterium]|nr:CRISPR-associated endonuclease Cas3'' [Candidatus Ozemobacteraceae bacterium]